MAGGLFGYPFEPNLKCVAFTAAVAGGYWYLPRRRWWVLVALLIAPYVAMAWYDHAYGCASKMQPTLIPFGRYVFLPLKPPGYKADFDKLPPAAIAAMDRVDHVTAWILLVLGVAYLARRRFAATA